MKGQGDENKYRENGENWAKWDKQCSGERVQLRQSKRRLYMEWHFIEGRMEAWKCVMMPVRVTIQSFRKCHQQALALIWSPFKDSHTSWLCLGEWNIVKVANSHIFFISFCIRRWCIRLFFFLSVWIYIPVGDLWVGCSSYNFNVIDYSVS